MNPTRFIKAGSFIDGSGDRVHRNIFLAVRDGFITAIGPAADLPENVPAAVDDLSHCTIVPALVDCSVTLTLSPSVDGGVRSAMEKAGRERKADLAARHIRYCHAHGVLGVAAGNDSIGLAEHLKEIMPAGATVDIRTSGIDFLRIFYGSITDIGKASVPTTERENLRNILLKKGDKKAVVVANGRQRVKEALAAGCDAIEQGYGMGEDNLRKMAATGVLWIPRALMAKNGLQSAGSGGDVTCRFSLGYVAPGKADPEAESFWKKLLADQLAELRLARKLGVKTAVGTGAGNVGILHGESMVEEMKLFIRAGWPLEEAIRCGSVIGAGFFGMENLGALTVGRKATFLVARGTVQQLPRKLTYLEQIYVDGMPSSA